MTRTLLVLERDPAELAALSGALQPLGRVIAQGQPGRLVETLQGASADLIVIGLDAAADDGLSQLSRMRTVGRFVPILLLIDGDSSSLQERLHARDLADEVLRRPVGVSLLRARTTALLNIKARFDTLHKEKRSLECWSQNLRERLLTEQKLTDRAFEIANRLCNSAITLRCNTDFALGSVKPETNEIKLALEDASLAAKRVEAGMKQLFELSGVDANQMQVTLSRCAFSCFQRILADHVRSRARSRRVSLSWDVAPDAHVEADPELLVRALEELLASAVLLTPRGGSLRFEARQRDAFEITLVSTGPKSAGADTLRAPTKPELDLRFCRRVVLAHGGTLIRQLIQHGFDTAFVYRVRLPWRIRAVV